MAYLLRKASATPSARVDISPGISVSSALSSWAIEFKVKVTATDLVLLSSGITETANIVFIRQTTCEVRRTTGGNVTFNLPLDPRTAERVYILRTSGAGIELLQDGVSCGVLGSSKNLFTINNLFTLGSSTRIGDLYYLKITTNGTLAHNYDPSASNGTGTTLIDTVSGNNGALVNFPTDNSQWVFYDSGTANQSTVSYDLGAIDYAVSSQITAPAIAASVSYDIGAIDYAVSAQQLAPGNNASLSYDIGSISYAVSVQQSAPQFSASVGYEIGGIGFAVQANTGAAIRTITALYDIGEIGWQVDSEWLPDDATAGIGYDIGEIAFSSSVFNIPKGGFPSEPSKQYPNNPGWRYSVFFR